MIRKIVSWTVKEKETDLLIVLGFSAGSGITSGTATFLLLFLCKHQNHSQFPKYSPKDPSLFLLFSSQFLSVSPMAIDFLPHTCVGGHSDLISVENVNAYMTSSLK